MIDQIKNYIEEFLEKPHVLFSGLPICPFVKKARLENKIDFQIIQDISLLEIIINNFYKSEEFEVVMVLFSENIVTCAQLQEITSELTAKYPDLVFFDGHPENNFNIAGVYTRQEPFPNIVIQKRNNLCEKSLALQKTNYYDNFLEKPSY